MKRSAINAIVKDAEIFFDKNHWALPPNPKWDVTDFGLNDFKNYGLVLVNLAEEKEYCEKIMYAKKGMKTPFHCHKKKKEDIIVRIGQMAIIVHKNHPEHSGNESDFTIQINGMPSKIKPGNNIILNAGERITLIPGLIHEFWPVSEECILGEVSTANDDQHDNFFLNPAVGRFSEIEEDEVPYVKLVSDN